MTEEEKIYNLEKFSELALKAHNKRYEWLYRLLLLASGSLSILISLRKTNAYNIFFSGTLICLGIGILFCAFALYGEVILLQHARDNYEKVLNRKIQGEEGEETGRTFLPKFYIFCEKLSYISLLLAIPMLIVYAIYIPK